MPRVRRCGGRGAGAGRHGQRHHPVSEGKGARSCRWVGGEGRDEEEAAGGVGGQVLVVVGVRGAVRALAGCLLLLPLPGRHHGHGRRLPSKGR